jgi:hypothetical protein
MVMARINEPPIVQAWLAAKPRCCFTCLEYEDDGSCGVHKMIVPAEYAGTVNDCKQWTDDPPF